MGGIVVSTSLWGPRSWEAKGLAKGHWVPESNPRFTPHSAWLPPTPRRVAGTYQVPGGSHQLVGGEREGLVTQVCVEHFLEDGPAASNTKLVGRSVNSCWLGTPGSMPCTGGRGTEREESGPHGADRQRTRQP